MRISGGRRRSPRAGSPAASMDLAGALHEAGRADGLAERDLLEEPGQPEAQDHGRDAPDEHRLDRALDRRRDARGHDGRQRADGVRAVEQGADLAAYVGQGPGRDPRRQVGRETVVHDGAEGGDPERAAHLPEELHGPRGHAEVAVVHRVLDHEDRHLHRRPDAQPEDDRVERDHRERRLGAHQRQQRHADRGGRQAADRPTPVAPRPADDAAGSDRAGHHAGRERQQQQARSSSPRRPSPPAGTAAGRSRCRTARSRSGTRAPS